MTLTATIKQVSHIDVRSPSFLLFVSVVCFFVLSNSVALLHAPTRSNTQSTPLGRNLKPGLLLTSYFTSLNDPQGAGTQRVESNSYEYIRPIFESVTKYSIPTVIFHDHLNATFLQTHSHPLITYQKVALRGSLSINDERFLFYQEYISKNRLQNQYQYLILSDISDVFFSKDPFTEFRRNSQGSCKLWIPREDVTVVSRRNIFNNCYDVKSNFLNKNLNMDEWIFNAGVIGGSVEEVTDLLGSLVRELTRIEGSRNCNMPALQYVLQTEYDTSTICSEGMCWKSKCDSHQFVHHKPPATQG